MLNELLSEFQKLGLAGLTDAFRNVGVDLTCATCMEIFYTGSSSGSPHSCTPDKVTPVGLTTEELAEFNRAHHSSKSIDDLISRQTELEEEIERLNASIDSKDDEIDTLEEQIEDLQDDNDELEDEVLENENPSSRRPPPHFKLPDERPGITHKFHIGQGELGHGYLTISTYPDSSDVGEIFIKMRKPPETPVPGYLVGDAYVEGLNGTVGDLSTFLRGVLDQLAISISIGLQRGIPLETYASKYKNMRFPPDGRTHNNDLPMCTSIVDYIARYLGAKFIRTEEWDLTKRETP